MKAITQTIKLSEVLTEVQRAALPTQIKMDLTYCIINSLLYLNDLIFKKSEHSHYDKELDKAIELCEKYNLKWFSILNELK